MTSAHSVFGPTPDNVRNRANWLGRYLTVERAYDAALDKVLKDAVASIDSAFGDLDDSNISRQIRRQQLALAHKAVRRTVRETFGDVRNLIRSGQKDAAVAAVNAHLFDERGVLARLFKSPADRQNYADSLRTTAERNIQATMTRVLETEIPLSERVWKTRALANGQVSRAINNGLAKGDSWLNIAESVKHLVRPDTPGGISYAAKRLGRTEINNAFHAQSIHDAQQSPWVDQMRWRLSKVHETDPGDECEVYAEQEFFPKEGVPVKPHPNCRCYVIPALLDYDQFETNLLLGQYDSYIDERMGKGTADRIIDFGGIYPKGVKPYGPDLRAKPNPETPPITANIKPIEVKTWRDVQNVNFIKYWFQQAHPDIYVINFNSDNISLEDAKQLLGAVDDMVAKYPALQGNIKSIVLGYGPDDEYARTIREFNGKSTIKFNLNWTKDHDHFYERIADNVATGFHPPGTDANPYYDMVVHELGHVLDNVGDQRARDKVTKQVLLDVYKLDHPKPLVEPPNTSLLPAAKAQQAYEDWEKSYKEEGKAKLEKWFQDFDTWVEGSHKFDKDLYAERGTWLNYTGNMPSRYALDDNWEVNPTEALAEAFLDVERNGDKAKPVSKALYDLLIEESKKDVGPRQLSDLVSAPASESGLVKGDYVPNGVEAWDFIEIPYDDGRWDYYEVYDKRNELGSSHDWTIEPRNYPEKRTTVTKFDRRSTVFFDPKETDVVEGEWGLEITTPEVPLEDSFEDIPEKMLWRGMSKEEYELARKRGYFESLGEYNVGGDPQAGKTYFSTDVGQAGHYATWYAPPQFKPTFDHPGYVVGIEDIPDLVREQGTEVGVPGRIPFKDVKKVYKGKPYAIFPGEQSAVREFNDNWVPGGSVQPGIRVKWSEVVVKPKDSGKTVTDEIMDLLGGPIKPAGEVLPVPGEPPIKGVPPGYEKYVKTLLGQQDRTSEATVFMSVEDLKKYAEYDRSDDVDQLKALEYVIKQDKGIKSPLQLSTNGKTALLHEGNHRLLVAESLGIKDVPVKITIDEEVIRNEGKKPRRLDKNLKAFLEGDFKKHKDGVPQVYWTGPDVAEPAWEDSITNDINELWQSGTQFDLVKDDIRKGGRAVQLHGYSGVPDDFYERLDGWDNDTPAGIEKLKVYGGELTARAVHAEPTDKEWYRGLRLTSRDAAKLEAGQQISLPISSFTNNRGDASIWARSVDDADHWISTSITKKHNTPVMFQIKEGAKVAEIKDVWEDGDDPSETWEAITFGRFNIVDVQDENGLKVVTLQQTSMIENVKRGAARTLNDEIPDISFIEDELTLNPADIIEGRARATGLAYLDDAREFLEKDKKIKVIKGLTPSQQLDPIAVAESVDAMDTMTTRFPHAGLKEFGFADIGENVAGYTEFAGTDKNWMFQSRILLNDEEASNYSKLKKDFAKAVAKKWHYVGSDENPILSTIYHEYGHVIYNATLSAGLDITPDQLDERLLKFWEKWYLPKELENIERKALNSMRADIPAALWDETFKRHKSLLTTLSYEDWIEANTSGYSRTGPFLETHEALAEAFDVVERLGEEAPEPAKVMRNFLLERYEETLKEKGIQEKKNWRYVKEHLEES